MTTPMTLAGFGKLPTRGDFVRSPGQAPLTDLIDHWLEQGMELLSADTRWRLAYDRMAPLDFAFVGGAHRRALAGRLLPSQDASGRRFPFVLASLFDVPGSAQVFAAFAPAALAPLWARLEAQAQRDDPLADLARCAGPIDAGRAAAEVDAFVDGHRLGEFEALLQRGGHALSLRRTLLAIGLLLQPVAAQGIARWERGLAFPLPHDPLLRAPVAALWLGLVVPFLRRDAFEIALFVRGTPRAELVVGFNGASARIFGALADPTRAAAETIATADADWVDAQLDASYGVRKLSSYLQQPGLSLRAALDELHDVFRSSP